LIAFFNQMVFVQSRIAMRGNSPRWLLWAFVATAFAGFAAVLPISAAFVGRSMETFNRLMIFQNWI
jgi:dolichyl-phosphate-mannose-protein mannosyltransferase